MNPKKAVLILLVCCTAVIHSFSQIDIGIPISANEKDADANGYYNPQDNTFILEQQHKGIIKRLLYDTSFNLKRQYTVKADSFTFAFSNKKPVFLKEYCTREQVYEIYGNKKEIQVWQLDFENGRDIKVASLTLQQYYKDERLLAIIPGETKLSFLCFSTKQNKILLYNYFPGKDFLLQREYTLPDISLTKEEIKERGKFLAVQYSNAFRGLFVSDLKNPSNYQVSPANQLLYNDSAFFFLLRTPYNAGYHLLELNRNTGATGFKNFLVNRLFPDRFNTPFEKIPAATAYDSVLILQSSSNVTFEYYFYNIATKELRAKYAADGDNSLYNLVHSDLKQVGTYISKDEEKEITKERIFLRRKNKGSIFIKAIKADNDSLLLTFGSYTPTGGVEGTLVSMASIAVSAILFAPAGMMGAMPYLTLSRNKFLFAYSKFSLGSLQPSTARNISTTLNTIASDKRIDDLEKNSSFIIEKKDRLYIGIFDKKKNSYNIIVY